MSLADQLAGAIEAARAPAEALMSSTVVFTRGSDGSDPTIDPDTLAVTYPDDVAVWSGPCTLIAGQARDTDQAGTTRTGTAYELVVPIDGTDVIQPGDLGVVTVDGEPVVRLIVDDVTRRTHAVTRRIQATGHKRTPDGG